MGFGIPISEKRLLKDKKIRKNMSCNNYTTRHNYRTCNYKTKFTHYIHCPKCGDHLRSNINIVANYK